MITLAIINGKYIDENGTERPLPKIYLIPQAGTVIGFDSLQEREQYISSLPKAWDKEEYCKQINEAHNALFESMYKALKYIDMAEIPLWLDDSEFATESAALKIWWQQTYRTVNNYCDSVTEQTALSIEDFIASLPALQVIQ